MVGGGEDRLVCGGGGVGVGGGGGGWSKDGTVSIKSVYYILGVRRVKPFSGAVCVPPKVSFFTWEASWGRC